MKNKAIGGHIQTESELKKKKINGLCALKKIGNSFYIDFGDVVVPRQSSLKISMQIPGS